MNPQHADLECETCGTVTEHELRYAGRLLESTRCTQCGTHTEVPGHVLLPDYVHDLEHRVASKPRRLVRRVMHEPGPFLRGLPRAVLRQPLKFAREFREVLRRS
jgi:hypothetical protein